MTNFAIDYPSTARNILSWVDLSPAERLSLGIINNSIKVAKIAAVATGIALWTAALVTVWFIQEVRYSAKFWAELPKNQQALDIAFEVIDAAVIALAAVSAIKNMIAARKPAGYILAQVEADVAAFSYGAKWFVDAYTTAKDEFVKFTAAQYWAAMTA